MKKILITISTIIALCASAIAQEIEKTEPVDFATLAERFHQEGGVHNGGRDWLEANFFKARSSAYDTFNEWLTAWLEDNQKYIDSFVSNDWTLYNTLSDEAKDKFLREMYFIGDFRNMDWPKFDELVKAGSVVMNPRIALTLGGGSQLEMYYAGSDAKGYFASIVNNNFELDGVVVRPEWQIEFIARSEDYARIKELPLNWFSLDQYKIIGGNAPALWSVDCYYLEAMCKIWGEMLTENPSENAIEVERQINNFKLAAVMADIPDGAIAFTKMNRLYILAKLLQKQP